MNCVLGVQQAVVAVDHCRLPAGRSWPIELFGIHTRFMSGGSRHDPHIPDGAIAVVGHGHRPVDVLREDPWPHDPGPRPPCPVRHGGDRGRPATARRRPRGAWRRRPRSERRRESTRLPPSAVDPSGTCHVGQGVWVPETRPMAADLLLHRWRQPYGVPEVGMRLWRAAIRTLRSDRARRRRARRLPGEAGGSGRTLPIPRESGREKGREPTGPRCDTSVIASGLGSSHVGGGGACAHLRGAVALA